MSRTSRDNNKAENLAKFFAGVYTQRSLSGK